MKDIGPPELWFSPELIRLREYLWPAGGPFVGANTWPPHRNRGTTSELGRRYKRRQ